MLSVGQLFMEGVMLGFFLGVATVIALGYFFPAQTKALLDLIRKAVGGFE